MSRREVNTCLELLSMARIEGAPPDLRAIRLHAVARRLESLGFPELAAEAEALAERPEMWARQLPLLVERCEAELDEEGER